VKKAGLFRKLRHQYRAYRKSKRLLKEGAGYQAAFLARHLAIPGEAEICKRVKASFPDARPRNKGELKILAIYHDYNWEGASLAPSLAKFGEVHCIDWRDPALAGGKAPHEAGWRRAMQQGLLEEARRLSKARPFDVVFTYLSGEQMTPQAMQELRGLNAPIVNLSLNDKESFVGKIRDGRASGLRDICRYFDLCWTSTEDALVKYAVEGATAIYLPEGGNPEIHRPYDEEKIYDVSFVGQCYGNRPEIVARLFAAGVKVEAFGPGWPNGALTTEEMIRTWSRSRINLGFGGVLGHKETYCLKGRDFEVPMSGGLYLTEHHDELLPFYDIGREIVTYGNFEELLEKIRWLLASSGEAEAIRQRGRARALKEHSWEMRFERVFKAMGVLEPD
jgi:spore maturation protein CgeB